MPWLIGPDQTGYMNGRNVTDSLQVINAILDGSFNMSDHCILLIDFNKAFDSMSHAFIVRTLSAFNFDILLLNLCG